MPFLPLHSWGHTSPSGMKFCDEILKTLSYHSGKNQKSLSHLFLERYRDVTDTKTDRQTDRITVANARYSYTILC